MKVNIIGKGVIPLNGIGTLAPRYHIDLTKTEIETLLGCQHLTVTDVATNLKITKLNIDGFFNPVHQTSPKPMQTTNVPSVDPTTPDTIVEDPVKEPVIDPPMELFATEEPIEEVNVVKTERIGYVDDTDETNENNHQSYPSHNNDKRNRKKKRHMNEG